MDTIIKWTGGKSEELPRLIQYFPDDINRFFDPLVGGGGGFLNSPANKFIVNDVSLDLISLYVDIKSQDSKFLWDLNVILSAWDETDILNTKNIIKKSITAEDIIKKMPHLISNSSFYHSISKEFSTLEKIVKRRFGRGDYSEEELKKEIPNMLKEILYMEIRNQYNNPDIALFKRTSLFFYIKTLAYSGLTRYNKNNKFNVPFGGNSYCKLDLRKKVNNYRSKDLLDKLKRTEIHCLDFEDFFNLYMPQGDDFIFLDPPYDTSFSTYENHKFGKEEHKRLNNFLNKCTANWLLVIKKTDFVEDLYINSQRTVVEFNKKYKVNIKNRNDKDVEHLIITNYGIIYDDELEKLEEIGIKI